MENLTSPGYFSTIFGVGEIAVYPKAPNEALQPEGGEAKFKAKPSWMTTRSSGKHNVIASHWGVFLFSAGKGGERRGSGGGGGTSPKKKTGNPPKEKPKVTQCHFFSILLGRRLIAMFFFCLLGGKGTVWAAFVELFIFKNRKSSSDRAQ